MKKLLVLLLCAMLFLPLGVGVADENITMDVLWFGSKLEMAAINAVLDAYHNLHPNVAFNIIETVYGDSNAKIQAMLAGGEPPCIARVSDTQVGLYKRYSLDIAGKVGGVDQYVSEYMPNLDATLFTNGDRVTAVPLNITHNGLIVNKTLFDKAGVEYPDTPDDIWTWDEFTAALETVQKNTGCKYGLVWDVSVHRWSTMLYQFGGQIFSNDRSSVVMNTEYRQQSIEALQTFVDLHANGILPTSVWVGGTAADDIWYAGEAAAFWCGTWGISNFMDRCNFEYDVAYNPIKVQRSTVVGGHYTTGFAQCAYPEQAADLLAFMHSKEGGNIYCRTMYGLSYRADSADLGWERAADLLIKCRNELENTAAASINDWMFADVTPTLMADCKPIIQSAIAGEISVEEAIDAFSDVATEALFEYYN